MTHYETLGVSPDAPVEEIIRAYRARALEIHPDRIPAELAELRTRSEERFGELAAAFAVLSSPGERARYDRALTGGESAAPVRSVRASRRWSAARTHGDPRTGSKSAPNDIDAYLAQRRRALGRKRILLIAGVLLACAAPVVALTWQATQTALHRLWWRVSSPLANSDAWTLEALRLYPETRAGGGAATVLRGYVKGLDGCYVIPARGRLAEQGPKSATIEISLERSGPWNRAHSYMGSCTPNSASLEVRMPTPDAPWATVDIIATDLDIGLSRRFVSVPVEWKFDPAERKP